MTTPLDIHEKKINSLFFKDERNQKEKEKKQFVASIRPEVRALPFFELKSKKTTFLDISPHLSKKIDIVIPKEAVDTKDPAVNNREFAKKNLLITLENQLTIFEMQRELTILENYLLYLIEEKKDVLVEKDIDEFISVIKERLVLFRDPATQELYEKQSMFLSEYNTILNYLRDNREWQKRD
jgi:hypothetical protein